MHNKKTVETTPELTPKSDTDLPKLSQDSMPEQPVHIKHGHKFIYGYLLLLILAAFAGLGGHLYHDRYDRNSNKTTQSTSTKVKQTSVVNPYADWKTYTLTSEGYTIKYPNDWKAIEPTVDGVELTSPVSSGYYFVLDLTSGISQDVNLNFLGNAAGTNLLKLNVSGDNNKAYYLAAQTESDDEVTGLGLATTPGGASTSFGIVDGGGSDNVVMTANLVPASDTPAVNNPYSLQKYQQQVDYVTLLKIFQSLSYKAPSPVVVSATDNKISMALPTDWHIMTDSNDLTGAQVISVDKDTRICSKYAPTDCGVAGCLDINDPVPCSYEAEFQPVALTALNNKAVANVWGLQVEKTNWTLSQAILSRVGELNASNTIAENNNPISGYQAEYLEVQGGDFNSEGYVDVYYFIKDGGYLLTFYNREKYVNHSINPDDENYTAYEVDFAKIVNSVQLEF